MFKVLKKRIIHCTAARMRSLLLTFSLTLHVGRTRFIGDSWRKSIRGAAVWKSETIPEV